MSNTTEEYSFENLFISADIFMDKKLTVNEKFIASILDNYRNTPIKEIMSFLKCSEKAVKKSMKKLQDLGYLENISLNNKQFSQQKEQLCG